MAKVITMQFTVEDNTNSRRFAESVQDVLIQKGNGLTVEYREALLKALNQQVIYVDRIKS